MFFIMGVNQGRKDLEYRETMICQVCGSYGNYKIYVTYSQLFLFFIPTFKWNRRYFVETSCCNSLYELDSEIGRDLEKGLINKIDENDLSLLRTSYKKERSCSNCRSRIEDDFEYCPYCGHRL